MEFRTAALVLLLFSVTLQPNAPSQESVAQLDKLQSRYKAQFDLTGRPLTELGVKYREALATLESDLKKNADLDSLVAIRKELERFDREKSPSLKDARVDSVARLQKIYRASYEKAASGLAGTLKELESAHRKQLEELKRQLTTAGQVNDALAVEKALKDLPSLQVPSAKDPLETGLVLHYTFEEEADSGTVPDASGTGNNGRLLGDAKILATSGSRGHYVNFDGQGASIECPHNESLVLTTDGSISFWVRPRQFGSLRGLVSKYMPEPSWVVRTWKGADQRKVSFGTFDQARRSHTELKEDRWTHVVLTLRKGDLAFYLDGRLDSEAKGLAPQKTNTNPVRIGSDQNGRFFNGGFDGIRIYQRALTSEEVAELFEIES